MERRDFFRISHDVLFDYKLIDSHTAAQDDAGSEFADALPLLKELRRLDKDSAQTLKLIADKNRLLADYLQNLSQKIDLLARHSLVTQADKDKASERVNLSEDGIAFVSPRTIYKGSYLAIRMIFLPHYVPLFLFAQVVRCEAKKESYQIAARFHRLSDADRQVLSRQILKAQVSQKKSRLAESLKK